MKTKRFAALLIAAALVLAVGMAGCTGGCSTSGGTSGSVGSGSAGASGSASASISGSGNGSSSGSSASGNTSGSGSSSSLSGDMGSSGNTGDMGGSGNSGDMNGSVPEDGSVPDASGNTGSSSSLSSSSATAAMGTDFGEIGALPSQSLDWGPGGPRDEKNRSQGAIGYNQKYGKYDALFLAADEPVVYMTFDEGYEFGLTPTFLSILREKGVKGLFFVTYDFVNREPELVKQIIEEGHVLGNHSWSHKNYSTLTPKEAAEDLTRLHDYVKENFGYEMRYFRFPSGNFNEQCLAVVQSMGYKSVFWSFAYKDWLTDDQPEAGPAEDKIVAAACPGNIYLLHAVSKTNAEVLGSVIDRVRDAGYTWGDPNKL